MLRSVTNDRKLRTLLLIKTHPPGLCLVPPTGFPTLPGGISARSALIEAHGGILVELAAGGVLP
jgi:hypothetical protein